MDQTNVVKVIEFFKDQKIEKEMDESEKQIAKTKAIVSKKKAKYFEKFNQLIKNILINCKTTPLKESPCSPILISGGKVMSDEKKKRKIVFNDENNIISETSPLQT